MSVQHYKNGQLSIIAGAGGIGGGGGECDCENKTFTGTTAEVEQAIADGVIKDDYIVNITDDVTAGAADVDVLDSYNEIMANTEENKAAGALGVKEGFEQINEDLDDIKTSFQDGCNTIVAGCTTYGSTPTSNSPSDIVNSIKTIHTNRYNAGVDSCGPKRSNGVSAVSTGVDGVGPYVYFPYGVYPQYGSTGNSYIYFTKDLLKSFANQASVGYNAGVTDTKKGTATAAQVLTGYTFTNSSSVNASGSMTNRGAWTSTPTSSGKVTIPAGYHNGSGYVDTSKVYSAGANSKAGYAKTGTISLKGYESKTATISCTDYSNYKNITASNIKIGMTSYSIDTGSWVSSNASITVKDYNASTGVITIQPSFTNNSASTLTINYVICII